MSQDMNSYVVDLFIREHPSFYTRGVNLVNVSTFQPSVCELVFPYL